MSEVYKTKEVDSCFGRAFVTVSEVDPESNDYTDGRYEINFYASKLDLGEIPTTIYVNDFNLAKKKADEAIEEVDKWLDDEKYN